MSIRVIARMMVVALLICGALGSLGVVILYEHGARQGQAASSAVETCQSRFADAVHTLWTARSAGTTSLVQEQALMAEIDALLRECETGGMP